MNENWLQITEKPDDFYKRSLLVESFEHEGQMFHVIATVSRLNKDMEVTNGLSCHFTRESSIYKGVSSLKKWFLENPNKRMPTIDNYWELRFNSPVVDVWQWKLVGMGNAMSIGLSALTQKEHWAYRDEHIFRLERAFPINNVKQLLQKARQIMNKNYQRKDHLRFLEQAQEFKEGNGVGINFCFS